MNARVDVDPVTDGTPVSVRQPGGSRRRPAASVLALARFEARELLLQIPVCLFLALYIGYTAWTMFSGSQDGDVGGTGGEFPVLQNADRATQTGPLLFAIALLLCVNRAVLRSRRHGTDGHFDVLVVEPWRRTVAHVLSVVPFALAVAVVVGAEFGRSALRPGAVGHGSPAELAVGPLAVMLAGALGVLFARLLPTSFAVPLFVVGGYVLATLAVASTDDAHWLRWLAPVVNDVGGPSLPSGLIGRPAGWHVLYLSGLVVFLLGVAVLVSGGRTVRMRAVTALALATTVVGAVGQAPGDSSELTAARAKASRFPEKVQTCVRHGRSTFCAFPEWTGRTADWAAVADRVQSLAGGAAGGRALTVRQRVEARYGLDSDSALSGSHTRDLVTVSTDWGGNRIPEFAVGVASVLVAGDESSGSEVCDARGVTVMWLALGRQPDPVSTFRDLRLDDSDEGPAIILAPTNPLALTAEQTTVVKELLKKPRYGVTAKVKAHWSELTSPKTSTARAAELLGVPVPKAEKDTEDGDECEA
ncbi:ABC transporter permease [Streptomyces sp. NPDC008313]|uniref:ABC transporter permease n=1 Tax=Streptomyces sp. NPDC008313 TaxID=3364826 RepID=UPI0036E0D16B